MIYDKKRDNYIEIEIDFQKQNRFFHHQEGGDWYFSFGFDDAKIILESWKQKWLSIMPKYVKVFSKTYVIHVVGD